MKMYKNNNNEISSLKNSRNFGNYVVCLSPSLVKVIEVVTTEELYKRCHVLSKVSNP